VVGASVGASVGAGVAVGGISVAVGGTRVGGTRVAVSVGAGVKDGSAVAVGDIVFVGASVGDGMVVAVAGGFVATTMATRAVGGGEEGGGVSDAHAAKTHIKNKKKSERSTFALWR